MGRTEEKPDGKPKSWPKRLRKNLKKIKIPLDFLCEREYRIQAHNFPRGNGESPVCC